MELIPIILAVIAITLFYFLYSYFSTKPTVLAAIADLSTGSNPVIILNTSNSRYAYGVWVYVDSWTNTSANKKTIFNRANNISLTLDSVSPTLECNLTTKIDSGGNTVVPITITDNFPIQKWTYVVISVDGSYIDCYLDGKLVKSKLVKDVGNNIPVAPSKSTNVELGHFDAHISKFKYWKEPVNTEDVWSAYKEGNGQSSVANNLNSYAANVSILKDGIVQNTFST
jgi:hypothetical protein